MPPRTTADPAPIAPTGRLATAIAAVLRRRAVWTNGTPRETAVRLLLVFVVLALIMISSQTPPTTVAAVLSVLAMGLGVSSRVAPRRYAAGAVAAAIVVALATGGSSVSIALTFVLIGLVGSRLPLPLAFPSAAAVLLTSMIPALLAGQPGRAVQFGSLYIATFAWAAGVRARQIGRERQAAMLERLEQAHAELRAAHEQLRLESERAVALAASEERERIARELHDVLAHTLTVLVVQVGGVKRLLVRDPGLAQQQLDVIAQVARDGLTEVRNSIHELHSPEEEGVSAFQRLVQEFAARTGLDCRLVTTEELPLMPPRVSKALYRVLQEALTNALRHGNAQAVTVELRREGGCLALVVRDDGVGADAPPPVAGGGNGLRGAAERLHRLGGSLESGPQPDGGFAVHAQVPLETASRGGAGGATAAAGADSSAPCPDHQATGREAKGPT